MSINRSDARKQAARLQASPMLQPQTDEGCREIVDCLMRHCQSAEHAAAVMTQVLDSALEVKGPITAWIASIARGSQVADQAPAGCEHCYLGPDINTGEVRWAFHVSITSRYGITSAGRCTCERGRWLAAKDAERATTAPVDAKKPKHEHPEDADWAMKAAGDR
jgi:hypothetical protein